MFSILPSAQTPVKRALVVSLLLWGTISASLFLTTLQQAAREQDNFTLMQIFMRTVLPFVPMWAMHWALGIACARSPERWVQPRQVLGQLLTAVVLVLPLFLFWDLAIMMLNAGKPLTDIFKKLHTVSPMWIWIDVLLMLLAIAVQFAINSADVTHRRATFTQQVEQDNLRLKLERLQGQLEPHFLFNALNTISALVRSADRVTAVTALARLSDLLRYALRASKNNWLTVQDEIAFLQDYLALQSLRFSDRLNVQLDIADEHWEEFPCPPLLLQPIIENAVRHGLESHAGVCTLHMSVRLNSDHILFRVRNPVPADAERQPGHGVGLQATRERLQLLFGERASLRTAEANGEFVAEVLLPLQEGH